MLQRSLKRLFSTSLQPIKIDITTLEQIRQYLKDVFPLASKVLSKTDTFLLFSSSTGTIFYLNNLQNQKFERLEYKLDKIDDRLSGFQADLHDLKTDVSNLKKSNENKWWNYWTRGLV